MKNKKTIFLLAGIILIILIAVFATIIVFKNKNQNIQTAANMFINEEVKDEIVENEKAEGKVDIIDITSKTRPYAVVVNNTPVAVKVQTGLNKAYLVYEIPTEGFTSRLMALYKDVDEVTIGTIRSSRHNFIDYALESNAIYVHYGWSKPAEKDQKSGSINYLNGLFDTPFWRENPEKLAYEHTAYTALEKVKDAAIKKGYKTELEEAKKTILLKYNAEDVDLLNKENVREANKIVIPYGSAQNTTTFTYDSNNKMYNRIEDGKNCIDHKTKEQVNTKNIIVQKIDYTTNYHNTKYWDLKTIGTGDGYFITNGYAVPIKWEKTSRKAKTKYTYLDGKEVEVSDGRTYIELQTKNQNLTIE